VQVEDTHRPGAKKARLAGKKVEVLREAGEEPEDIDEVDMEVSCQILKDHPS
jgi:hypothetical protein